MTADQPPPQQWAKTCAKCGEAEPGEGGILCARCRDEIASAPLYPEPAKEVTP